MIFFFFFVVSFLGCSREEDGGGGRGGGGRTNWVFIFIFCRFVSGLQQGMKMRDEGEWDGMRTNCVLIYIYIYIFFFYFFCYFNI